MPQDRFEEIFKQRLGEAEVAPSSGLWEKIQGELPPPTPFYRRSSFIAACLGAFLLVSGSVGYFVTNYDIKIVAEADASVAESHIAQTSNIVVLGSEDSEEYAIVSRESFAERAKRNYGSFVAKSLDVIESAKTAFCSNNNVLKSATKRSQIANESFGSSNSASTFMTSNTYSNANTGASDVETAAAQTLSDEVIAAFTYDQVSQAENVLASNGIPNALLSKGTYILAPVSELLAEVLHPGFEPIRKTRKGLHIGGFYGYNNTWIVSKNFGLKSHKSNNVNYDIDFGGNYGVALGYDFNSRWGIQTEWVINSAYRQNYAYNWEGSRHLADIKLNYFQFPVLVKYHVAKEKSNLSYLLGLRVARLKSAGLEVNTPSVRVVDVLNTNEVGAIVGLEYGYRLNRHYNFTLGARGSVGRAFNSWSEINEPGKPFNIALGLRAGLQYNFVK